MPGVIDVKQNLAPFIGKAKYQFFLSLSVIAPVPFLAALLIVLFISRKTGGSPGKLGKSIDSITKVSDLKYLELGELNLGFSELNDIAGKLREFSGKLKSIAVDKDLLEFEIRLLEKFVITSGVIKNWHEYVSLLLIKINKVITTYTLFSIFKVDEGVFEVAIFWLHEPSSQTKALLEKVARKLLEGNPQFSGESAIAIVRGTVSIGIGVYPDHATEKKDLFMFAGNMMYKAKPEGKNRIGVPTEDDVIESFRHTSETSIIIMNAVENRDILPYFQPLVDARTRKTKAVEVLGRIRLGDGNILEAEEFIEIAGKIGVIRRFDYIVMEKALHEVRNQNFQGNIFINLSPRALVLNAYIPEVRRIMAESGIDPGRIVFEITERETIKKMALLETFVCNLKMEGYKLAIDDFGSGFSSFHYLKRFPIDYLKIEGDFIVNMTSSEKDMAFVRSIAMLAKELGIMTVAEYVENEEVLQSVSDIGIDLAQGYYISKLSAKLPPY